MDNPTKLNSRKHPINSNPPAANMRRGGNLELKPVTGGGPGGLAISSLSSGAFKYM